MKHLTIVLLFIYSLSSFAYNPHHKLTIALANIEQTEYGQKLVQQARELGATYFLFHCANSYEAECSKLVYLTRDTIFFHFDLNGSSFNTLVDSVEYGLQQYIDKYKR